MATITSDELASALTGVLAASLHQSVLFFASHHERYNAWFGSHGDDSALGVIALRLRRTGGIMLVAYWLDCGTDRRAWGLVRDYADGARETEKTARKLADGLADLALKPSVRMPSLSVTLRHVFDWGESASGPPSSTGIIKIDRPSLEVQFRQIPGYGGWELPRGWPL